MAPFSIAPALANIRSSLNLGGSRAEPVALLQVDGRDAAGTASDIYREVRRGRCVVAVVAGPPGSLEAVRDRLDRIGVESIPAAAGEPVVRASVTLVAGPEAGVVIRPKAENGVRRVALAGCGVVGGGLLPRLLADSRFVVVGVLVRDPSRKRDVEIPRGLVLSDPAALLAREPDILIDVLSDASTSRALIRASLARGVDVITASKQALATDLPALLALAETTGSILRYSASVGGGVPMIETVRRARTHGEIVRIDAILNGTCNFILNRMKEGLTFDDALTAAQEAGFAEDDPCDDLSGLDAAAKLSILAWEATGDICSVNRIERHPPLGTDTVVADVRQTARLCVKSNVASITLTAPEVDSPFACLTDERNALKVTTGDGAVFTTQGRGAGRIPTSESIWADLLEDRVGLGCRISL